MCDFIRILSGKKNAFINSSFVFIIKISRPIGNILIFKKSDLISKLVLIMPVFLRLYRLFITLLDCFILYVKGLIVKKIRYAYFYINLTRANTVLFCIRTSIIKIELLSKMRFYMLNQTAHF